MRTMTHIYIFHVWACQSDSRLPDGKHFSRLNRCIDFNKILIGYTLSHEEGHRLCFTTLTDKHADGAAGKSKYFYMKIAKRPISHITTYIFSFPARSKTIAKLIENLQESYWIFKQVFWIDKCIIYVCMYKVFTSW